MTNPDATIARLVHDQRGVVNRSQALDAGLTSEQLDHRRESEMLRRVFRGVYQHAAVPLTRHGRLLAAVLAAGDGAVASHRSAAWLHGFDGARPWRPEITVPRSSKPLHDGIHVHRTNRLPDEDVMVVEGVPATTAARTLLDLGAVAPYEVVEQTVSDAVIRKLVSHAQLLAEVERVGGRGRRGTAALRAVLRHALPDERLESELERRLVVLLPSVPGLELQYEVVCPDGQRFRLDAALPGRKVGVEANGHLWHGTAQAMRRDMARRRALAAIGWTLYEYGWSDVVEHPATTRAELQAILLPDPS